EMCTLLEPAIERPGLLAHAMLHIHLLRAIAREGDVQSRQDTTLALAQPFELIEEIAAEVALAEEEPVAPVRTVVLALLHERSEGRHASAGSDHDEGCRRIGRQAE